MAYEKEKTILADQILVIGKSKGIKSMNAIIRNAALEYNQIGKLVHGKGNPTLETLYKIADALEVPIKELFDFDEKSKPKKPAAKKPR